MAAQVESEWPTVFMVKGMAKAVLAGLTDCFARRSPEDINKRLDRLIKSIRDKYHSHALDQPLGTPDARRGDVLIVAHGHILRAFAHRWTGSILQEGPLFLLEAGGVGTLR